jgi:hypothetical protein
VSCCNVDGKVIVLEQRGRAVKSRIAIQSASTGLAMSADRSRIFAAHPNGVRVLDRRLRLQPSEEHFIPGADVHDVKPDGDNLLVVESSFNKVTSYAAPGVATWSWAPSPGEGDRSHVNSLLVRDGAILTSVFSPEGLGEPWSQRIDGGIVEIPADRATGGRILFRGVQQPHSLVDRDGSLWFCESRRRRVMRVEPSDELTPVVVADLPAYTRGLAITDEWLLVGQSRSDAHFVRPLLGQEPRKDVGMCGVWFISRVGDERFFVELPAIEVYDILELRE